jgi:signal transduction histidine kinase
MAPGGARQGAEPWRRRAEPSLDEPARRAKNALAGQPGQNRVSSGCNGSEVRVRLRYTGCGIPHEDLPRIFDPGFTTKGVGVGTGLGLAICHQIVQEHGRSIKVSSRPRAGTTVSVSLHRSMGQRVSSALAR